MLEEDPEDTQDTPKDRAAGGGQAETNSENISGQLETTAPHSDTPNLDHGIRTLYGECAEDEFESDAINYQVLLGKIDTLLEKLNLDA